MRKRKTLLSLLLALLVHAIVLAQTPATNGKVTDDKGNAVPFATVSLKGSTKAVSADKDGNFSIDAPKGASLIISAAGFETKETVITDGSFVTVIINKLDNLQEVVVTALGIKRTKNSLPYATQQIKADELNRTPNTNFINNLAGKVAGLQITSSNALGGSANAILRGAKSLTQSNQALFVVDGVPYDNITQNQSGYDLGNVAADINPDDIESVTVLKGAAASALYGSRASNGVIVITTKKGSRT